MDYIDEFCGKYMEMKIIEIKLKIITGKLAFKKLQYNSISPELEQLEENEAELLAKTFDASCPFNKRQEKSEAVFESSMRMNDPCPCSANWNDTQYDPNHFQKLLNVQRHKCVGKYCLRKNKHSNGT